MLISYVFALVSSGAITEKDLDTQAEGFIKEELEAVELAAAKEGEPIKYTSSSSLSLFMFIITHSVACLECRRLILKWTMLSINWLVSVWLVLMATKVNNIFRIFPRSKNFNIFFFQKKQ